MTELLTRKLKWKTRKIFRQFQTVGVHSVEVIHTVLDMRKRPRLVANLPYLPLYRPRLFLFFALVPVALYNQNSDHHAKMTMCRFRCCGGLTLDRAVEHD
jgi:hypothetical protein